MTAQLPLDEKKYYGHLRVQIFEEHESEAFMTAKVEEPALNSENLVIKLMIKS
jgi:hypothetical protein